jgi:hypothetical protein
VIAGLTTPAFDRIRRESENLLAPGGKVVLTPNQAAVGYSQRHADDLIAHAHQIAASIDEVQRFKTLLLYMDFADQSTERLLDRFFPFSLPLGLEPFVSPEDTGKRVRNERLNELATRVVVGSRRLRERSRLISAFTDVANLTPLLLPLRNFRSESLRAMLRTLYRQLASSPNPEELIKTEIRDFFAQCPRTHAGTEVRHCFCDGELYFRSPGKHRHGYFRQSPSGGHLSSCLLNARSRIGGSYDYRFHYDCEPKKGRLRTAYEDCHGAMTVAKSTHVNIAPNDFII